MLTATCTLLTFSLALAQPATQPVEAARGFLFFELQLDGQRYPYVVYVPPEYDPRKPWPVILFLHGSGERGRDGLKQTEVGIGRAIRLHRSWIPAIVVMPQCPPGRAWDDAMLRMALACVQQASQRYHLDPRRVYLTGLSLGGAGAWRLAAELPGRFAAVVPICGFVGDPRTRPPTDLVARMAPRLARRPIWAFHGAADPVVSVEQARTITAAVRAAGGQVQYTEIPGAGHNVWDRAYGNPKLWTWLFAQRLDEVPSHPAEPRKPHKP